MEFLHNSLICFQKSDMRIKIVPIVEGYGEVEAVFDFAKARSIRTGPRISLEIPHPIRILASKPTRRGELERALQLAYSRIETKGGIFILYDCDWPGSCPAKDGPSILRRAARRGSSIPVSVVLAKMEFETWFIAAAQSIQSCRGYRPISHMKTIPREFEAPKNGFQTIG